jgi:hypothetical protein
MPNWDPSSVLKTAILTLIARPGRHTDIATTGIYAPPKNEARGLANV